MSTRASDLHLSPAREAGLRAAIDHEASHREDGTSVIELSVPDLHCGRCLHSVERCLQSLAGVLDVRANLTTRRVRVRWARDQASPPLLETLEAAGYPASIINGLEPASKDDSLTHYMRALAVAGFAAANIMMLSISVWVGADDASRQLFHALSAAIALPAVAYAGSPFFRSAWQAVSHRRVNMDVPISIGILLTLALSLHDALRHGDAVYFDAVTMLVFFLLIGRTLDLRMRHKVRMAVESLERLLPIAVPVEQPDGSWADVAIGELAVGTRLRIEPDQRVAVDARVVQGCSTVDRSLVTGESVPVSVALNDELLAGTLNVSDRLLVEVVRDAESSSLSEIRKHLSEGETRRGQYRRLADRAARLYAPVVHVAAALSLAAWFIATGDLHRSISVSIAVLIITCPCALGLAVPIVQVIAARRLLDRGVLMKDGAALERLARVRVALFDKTGTLTRGLPSVIGDRPESAQTRALAVALASHSRHPHARAIVDSLASSDELAASSIPARLHAPEALHDVVEIPGSGVEAWCGPSRYRLGKRSWTLEPGKQNDGSPDLETHKTSEHESSRETRLDDQAQWLSQSVLTRDGGHLATFSFHDSPRDDAQTCIDALRDDLDHIGILSGDRRGPVDAVANDLGLSAAESGLLPDEKVERIRARADAGDTVLMIGDGLNDLPALSTASVSMAPGSAVDASRQAVDFVLLGDALTAIPESLRLARRAHRLYRQNIGLALLYNLFAMPLAMAGLVTPLIAALSMSLSSILVVLNAMRLTR